MIFKFSDNKELTFAYADLLDIGIPETSIVACFDEYVPVPQPPAAHQSFLQHLHSWLVATKALQQPNSTTGETTDPPVSPLFRKHGGTLEVQSRDRAAEIIGIAVHHLGEMVA